MRDARAIDPGQIAEQRDAVEHLVQRLLPIEGAGELLAAMAGDTCLAHCGPHAGRFSLSAFCRQRGMTHRRASRLLQQMRSRLESPSANGSRRCSAIARPIAMRSAPC